MGPGTLLQHSGSSKGAGASPASLHLLIAAPITMAFQIKHPRPRQSTHTTKRCRHTIYSSAAADGAMASPPFAALSTPVYSLSTQDAQGGHRTMNLVTYTSPISIRPRFYALGLYRGTLSWENMLETGEGVLQILGKQHAGLFQLLGKQSGRTIDKLGELTKNGQTLSSFAGNAILEDCYGVVHLRIDSEPRQAGDHDLVICSVEGYETMNTDVEPLYTAHLKELGLM